jgi:glucose/arabinose dehydrogenase
MEATALLRATLSADESALENPRVIFSQRPKVASGLHFGCRIVEGRDGTLFMTLGERFSGMQRAQTLDNHLGKVIRVNKDGSVPADNPFVKQAGAVLECLDARDEPMLLDLVALLEQHRALTRSPQSGEVPR